MASICVFTLKTVSLVCNYIQHLKRRKEWHTNKYEMKRDRETHTQTHKYRDRHSATAFLKYFVSHLTPAFIFFRFDCVDKCVLSQWSHINIIYVTWYICSSIIMIYVYYSWERERDRFSVLFLFQFRWNWNLRIYVQAIFLEIWLN